MIAVVKKYLISSRIGTKLLPLNLPAHQAVIEEFAIPISVPYHSNTWKTVKYRKKETLLPK